MSMAEKAVLLGEYAIGRARRLYFMALPENEADYKKSRHAYIAGDAAAQTMVQLAGGTFLAGLMSYAGISEGNIGVFTSLASFAALFQLFLIGYVRKLKKCKLFICFSVLMKICFAFIYFVPLLPIGDSAKIGLIIGGYFAAQIFLQIGTPAINDWMASLVPMPIRGSFLAIKDSFAVFAVATTMLGAGILTDYFKERDPLTGFVLMGIMLAVLVLINFVAFSAMKEPRCSYLNSDGKEIHGQMVKKVHGDFAYLEVGEGVLAELFHAFASKRFRKAFILNCLYITAFYIASPFNASYQIRELALPYTFIMLVGFLCNLYRVSITPMIGRMADRIGMAPVLKYALFCLGLSFLVLAFTVPENAMWMFVISSICSASGWTFIGSGLLGIQLEFVDGKKRILQLSLISSVSGVYGFFISFLGGRLIDYMQKEVPTLLGYRIYPQQVLNILGFLMILVAAWYAGELVKEKAKET
ncbi:MAG: MFS transporter, partial [Hungatella sp.]